MASTLNSLIYPAPTPSSYKKQKFEEELIYVPRNFNKKE